MKNKSLQKIIANNSNYYLGYLNKLVDEYRNTCHYSVGKNPIHTDYSVLTEEIESCHKAPKFRFGDRVRITTYKNIFSKGYTKNWSKVLFVIDSVLKTNPWKIKDLKAEKTRKSFYERQLMMSKL